jgi:hypothetical protein
MRHGLIFEWLKQPSSFNLAVDVKDFQGIHIPRINTEDSRTAIWLLFFKWPPITPTSRKIISANPSRSINYDPIETYTHPQFSQKLKDISLSPQTY